MPIVLYNNSSQEAYHNMYQLLAPIINRTKKPWLTASNSNSWVSLASLMKKACWMPVWPRCLQEQVQKPLAGSKYPDGFQAEPARPSHTPSLQSGHLIANIGNVSTSKARSQSCHSLGHILLLHTLPEAMKAWELEIELVPVGWIQLH